MRKAGNLDSAVGFLAHTIGLVVDREPHGAIECELYALRGCLRRLGDGQTKHG